MNKKIFGTVLLVVLTSAVVGGTTAFVVNRSQQSATHVAGDATATPVSFASMPSIEAMPTDFTVAAEQSVHSVVHVKVTFQSQQTYARDPFFDFFFGHPGGGYVQEIPEQKAAGSGVVISSDGYIVTNNHVIDKATNVEVTLNDKRTFKAQVIGSDAYTDIALLKIEATDLQPIALGNSDNLKVGEWVLAVGNPFNLTSTVTAGIVSAKARNINILSSDMKIESFIQTDAAVNPGNSGGALVNTKGELVGINTAIASQTGSYAGYSFAVPVSIVSKVVADLKEFGVVQRAVLGIQIRDISDDFAKEKKLTTLNGVYVEAVIAKGSAQIAGIKEGDVITAVNEVVVKSVSELKEQVGRYRPGDKISITYVRGGKTQQTKVELKNRSGNTDIVKIVDISALGVTFQAVPTQLKYQFNLSNGLQIKTIDRNGKMAKAGIEKGFIVLKINHRVISSTEDVSQVYGEALASDDEKVLFVTGVYPNGRVSHYAVALD